MQRPVSQPDGGGHERRHHGEVSDRHGAARGCDVICAWVLAALVVLVIVVFGA